MAVNSTGDFIRGVFPNGVNRNGIVFKALLADRDKKNGVLESVFSDLETERKKWCDSGSIWNQTEEQFAESITSITVLEWLQYETEEMFKKRNKYVFCGSGSGTYGTLYDIHRIFSEYFGTECFIVNNSMEFSESLLVNGDFENEEGWQLAGCTYSSTAAIEGTKGLLFAGKGDRAMQTLSAKPNATYCLHAFCRGNLDIRITDNNGRVYEEQSGTWQDEAEPANSTGTEWQHKSVVILTDSQVSELTISFENAEEGNSCLDYARLFLKDGTPCFSLIASFQGAAGEDTLHLAPKESLNPDVQQSYFNQTFIFGSGGKTSFTTAKDLLEVLRPSGVHASLEFLTLS